MRFRGEDRQQGFAAYYAKHPLPPTQDRCFLRPWMSPTQKGIGNRQTRIGGQGGFMRVCRIVVMHCERHV